MLELIYRIFVGHNHKWKIIQQGEIGEGRLVLGFYYNCQCEICGKIKSYNV